MHHPPILERFLRYVKIDTMSDSNVVGKRPSTEGQFELLELLKEELLALKVEDITLSPEGYLVARIPSNAPHKKIPTIGFMAHVDVADDVMGNGVNPRVIETYDGQDIVLNDAYTLTVEENPTLKEYKGTTLVVTDGTTLLGGDNKAGVAILVTLAANLLAPTSIEHGEVELIFTTDEEIGRGMEGVDVSQLRSRCCYTIDGSARGEIDAECFNAATVTVDFYGVPFHLGAAKGRMVNSVTMAASFIGSIPQLESPEASEEREGYYCAEQIRGSIAHTNVVLYLRDFDLDQLKRRIRALESLAESVELLYTNGKVELKSEIVYKNMFNYIKEDPAVMEAIFKAGERIGIPLKERYIRGGTDGSRLSEMGIPTPNIFTGSHNLHSRYEWLSLTTMEESLRLVEEIVAYWAGEAP
jgi:tripeptide aminopeptidase